MKFKREERGRRKTKGNEVESLQNLQSPLESPSKPPNPSKELPPRVPKESLSRKIPSMFHFSHYIPQTLHFNKTLGFAV